MEEVKIKKMKNKLAVATNIMSIGMGYVLSQNNIMLCKIAMCLSFLLWIILYSQVYKD